jgi:hypothetical protein
MSRTQVWLLAVASTLVGAIVAGYVVIYVSPYSVGDQLNVPALVLFFTGFFLLATGIGCAAALLLHRRWPVLAGPTPTRRQGERTRPGVALRQGALFGLALATLVALAILRVLDITFAIVTLLLAGLIEAFAQARR